MVDRYLKDLSGKNRKLFLLYPSKSIFLHRILAVTFA